MPIFNTEYKSYYEWKPGINTRLYLPLNGDVLDYSGNNNNGTWSGTTEYKTIGDKQYAYINTNSAIALTSFPVGTGNPDDFTFSCWVKTNSSNGRGVPFYIGTEAIGNRFELILNYVWSSSNYQHIIDLHWYDLKLSTSTSSPSNVGEWIYVVYTYKKSTQTSTLYINNTQVGSDSSYPLNIGSNFKYIGKIESSDNVANYGLSEIIFENGIWSAQERSDYYNGTKGNYGL